MNAVRYLRNCILVLGLDPKVARVIRDPLNAHFYRYLRNGRVPYLRSSWRKSSPRSNQTSDETVKPRRPDPVPFDQTNTFHADSISRPFFYRFVVRLPFGQTNAYALLSFYAHLLELFGRLIIHFLLLASWFILLLAFCTRTLGENDNIALYINETRLAIRNSCICLDS